jgi:signal transduction histidine kinase
LKRSKPNLPGVQSALEQVVRAGERIEQIIASTRAMFGKESRDKHPVDVGVIVGEVLALLQGELAARRISLRNEMRGRGPQVMGDRVQLQQVLLNLITNAVDAMSSEAKRPRQLTIAAGVDDEAGVNITVADTGSGIDPAHLDRIFDPFFTTKSNGMGMGLAICRSIIEAHGGKLWASPRSPCGTVFHLALPSAGQAARGGIAAEVG